MCGEAFERERQDSADKDCHGGGEAIADDHDDNDEKA